MSNRISSAEKAAREFLRPYYFNPASFKLGLFVVNREGHPSEQRPEIQWLLKIGWVRRERVRSPSGICPARQITMMRLTALGNRSLDLSRKD